MLLLLRAAVDAVNIVSRIITAMITFNYYLGESMVSAVLSVLATIKIVLEDLLVFYKDVVENASNIAALFNNTLNNISERCVWKIPSIQETVNLCIFHSNTTSQTIYHSLRAATLLLGRLVIGGLHQFGIWLVWLVWWGLLGLVASLASLLLYLLCMKVVAALLRFVFLVAGRARRARSWFRASPVPDDLVCVVCRARGRCLLLLPCRHLCLCQECEAPLLAVSSACPVCRQQISRTIKTYL